MVRALTGTKSARLFLFISILLNVWLLVSVFHGDHSKTTDPVKLIVKSQPPQSEARTEVPVYHNSTPVNNNARISSLEHHEIIFVGGVPRSGTTLVRAMLDAHPDVRCGEETRVIPRIISMRSRWDRSTKEHNRLEQARISSGLLDKATRAFVDTIILGHGPLAPHLCNKDPLVMSYIGDVARLYPRSKFVLLIRDGRAVAHSIVSRNVSISGVNSRSYLSAAMFWNKHMIKMTRDCDYLGSERCLEIFYEKLVQEPKVWMEKLLRFLNVPWHDNVLRHHELINKEFWLSK